MRIDLIPVGQNPPDDLNVIIEVPTGGEPVKYEFDKASGALFVDRILHTPMRYPANYGFVPHTLSDDGDPIDVLVCNAGVMTPPRYRETEDGFRIAEEDLAMRGAGDVIGTAQSGLPRFRVADLERQADLLATARQDARLLLDQDPELSGERGQAIRLLLWLMEQDRAIGLMAAG